MQKFSAGGGNEYTMNRLSDERVDGVDGSLAALRVLLVEDSPVVAERLRESLRELPGIAVTDTVDRESTAVDKLTRGGIDVVILDLHLNRGTGFGVLRALRGQNGERPVAIILTNYDLPEYRRQALALGADHFLDKARDFERLPELLNAIREKRGGNGLDTLHH